MSKGDLGQGLATFSATCKTGYACPEQGVPPPETNEAIRLCARLKGMMTDPVNEGKSMQGLTNLVRKDVFPAASKVFDVHLGGVPTINGYSDLYRKA